MQVDGAPMQAAAISVTGSSARQTSVANDRPDGGGGVVLEAEGVSKSFAGVAALIDVDFDLKSGEVHALVGENGAAKSTLMKILAGVHIEYDGAIRLAGEQTRFPCVLRAHNPDTPLT